MRSFELPNGETSPLGSIIRQGARLPPMESAEPGWEGTSASCGGKPVDQGKMSQTKRCQLVLVPGDRAGGRDPHCRRFKKAPAIMVDFFGPQSYSRSLEFQV